MKIAMISDMHILSKNPEQRSDNIIEKQWSKLHFILKYCQDHQIQILLQAGDFFDGPRNWDTLQKTIEYVLPYQLSGFKIYSVEGQHDRYMRSNSMITNRTLLNDLGLIKTKDVVRYKTVNFHGINFEDGMNISETINEHVKQHETLFNEGKTNILIIHAPISDAPLFPGHEFSKAFLLLKKHKEFDVILCGDVHKEFELWDKNRCIINTGSMIRREKNEYNKLHLPLFYIYDTAEKSLKKIFIPCDAYQDVFQEKETTIESEVLADFINAVKNPVSNEMDVYKKIERFIFDNGIEKEVMDEITEVQNDPTK